MSDLGNLEAPLRRRRAGPSCDDRPCRHACKHYDCMMDRGEPLPDWVVGYRAGVRYHDDATRARAREEAVRVVDGRLGYAIEYASDPAAHEIDYQEEQARVLAAWAARDDERRRRGPGGEDAGITTMAPGVTSP